MEPLLPQLKMKVDGMSPLINRVVLIITKISLMGFCFDQSSFYNDILTYHESLFRAVYVLTLFVIERIRTT